MALLTRIPLAVVVHVDAQFVAGACGLGKYAVGLYVPGVRRVPPTPGIRRAAVSSARVTPVPATPPSEPGPVHVPASPASGAQSALLGAAEEHDDDQRGRQDDRDGGRDEHLEDAAAVLGWWRCSGPAGALDELGADGADGGLGGDACDGGGHRGQAPWRSR